MANNQLEPPLAKEGSSHVYALAFDEFQHALGDPGAAFGSMNMDEFLTNIWTAEESQAMAAAMNPLAHSNGCLATQISMQKQRSLCLPRTLSMRMVEEVWKSLQLQQETLASASASASAGGCQQLRQLTLGEVTLEDFLVKAGIKRENPTSNPSPCSFQGNGGFPGQGNDARYNRSCNENRPMCLNPLCLLMPPSSIDIMQQDGMLSPVHTPAQQGDRMVNPYSKAFSQQQQHETEQILQGSTMVEAAPSYSNTPLSPGHDESSADTSNLLTPQFGVVAQPGRKRHAEGPIEKLIQRRQRRMNKNRESVACSRARKQVNRASQGILTFLHFCDLQ